MKEKKRSHRGKDRREGGREAVLGNLVEKSLPKTQSDTGQKLMSSVQTENSLWSAVD